MAIGVSREAYYKWMREDEDFKQTIDALNESFIEKVESKLMEKINEGSDVWIWRYLKAHRPLVWKEEIKSNQLHQGTIKFEVVNKTIGETITATETPAIGTEIVQSTSEVPKIAGPSD
jgi:hypothetical protein